MACGGAGVTVALLPARGRRAADSVTGHGRLRLLLREEVSSPASSVGGSAPIRRRRDRKANILQRARKRQ